MKTLKTIGKIALIGMSVICIIDRTTAGIAAYKAYQKGFIPEEMAAHPDRSYSDQVMGGYYKYIADCYK